MYDAMPVAWRRDSRGFWTKRKKTALSLVSVMAILASVALAFKLFDQVVPNNVVRDAANFSFEIWKRDAAAGDVAYVQAGTTVPVFAGSNPTTGQPISIFPGDTRTVDVKIINSNATPAKDASFYVFVDAIIVRDSVGNPPGTPAQAQTFLNFFRLQVDKHKILAPGGGDVANEDDHGVVAGAPNANPDTHVRPGLTFTRACDDLLRLVLRLSPCKLGLVRKNGARDALNGRTDQRYYIFKLLEEDTGADQSIYSGWSVTFNLVFQARVPPEPESVLLER